MIEEAETQYWLLYLWAAIVAGLCVATFILIKEREGSAADRFWQTGLAAFVVLAIGLPIIGDLYDTAFAVTPAADGVRMAYLEPRPAAVIPYGEIEGVEVCRHYRFSEEGEITGSSWTLRIRAAGDAHRTYDGEDGPALLAAADRIARRSGTGVAWFWTLGRGDSEWPATEAVVRGRDPHIDRVPEDYEPPLKIRIIQILDALPF